MPGAETLPAPREVLELVARFEQQFDAYKAGQYNETQLRRELLDPIFKLRGCRTSLRKGRLLALPHKFGRKRNGKPKMKLLHMEGDTPLRPRAIAEAVWEEASAWLGASLPRRWLRELIAEANTAYAHNSRFRRRLRSKGSLGREHLWMFMRHWLAAIMQQRRPRLHRLLPPSYNTGEPLPTREAPFSSCTLAGRDGALRRPRRGAAAQRKDAFGTDGRSSARPMRAVTPQRSVPATMRVVTMNNGRLAAAHFHLD